jgi:N-acetylmuramoyl-L-alanine amidase
MIEIVQDFIHINPFSRDGSKLKAKNGIAMHYTADPGAPARNISHYFDSLKDQNPNDDTVDRYAGAHFSVDRFTKIQSIPTDERGYHVGSSQPYLPDAIRMLGDYPNNYTVGIEMCIEADGSIHEDTFQNAVDLAVWLIRNDGFPNVIFTHKGIVGWKDCPLPWVHNPSEFERFKQTVNDKLKELEQMDELLRRLSELEDKVKVLEKTAAPDWFVIEFGSSALNGIVNEPAGDANFWRNVAVSIRLNKKVTV